VVVERVRNVNFGGKRAVLRSGVVPEAIVVGVGVAVVAAEVGGVAFSGGGFLAGSVLFFLELAGGVGVCGDLGVCVGAGSAGLGGVCA